MPTERKRRWHCCGSVGYLSSTTLKDTTMNHVTKSNAISPILEALSQSGLGGMLEAMQVVINQALLLERERFIGVGRYERSEDRRDQSNGFKSKTIKSRIGELEVAVPQVRSGDFYPESLERGQRSERALLVSLAEMYIQGVSTRKVKKVIEKMCGFEVSSSMVSRATAELDGVLTQWRERPLGEYPYVYLDARYENVREAGVVRDCAVLWAIGVTAEGQRDVLGVSVELSEAEVHWRSFLESLTARGLRGIRLIISDDHAGLKAARRTVLPSVPWQRCQFHLQQNLHSHIPRKDWHDELHGAVRSIFASEDLPEAMAKLDALALRYAKDAPKLSQWLLESIPDGFTVFAFPKEHQKRLRTTNGIERANQEIKRRTRTARIFTNSDSCLRLVSAILMEMAEDWLTGNKYLDMKLLEKQ